MKKPINKIWRLTKTIGKTSRKNAVEFFTSNYARKEIVDSDLLKLYKYW